MSILLIVAVICNALSGFVSCDHILTVKERPVQDGGGVTFTLLPDASLLDVSAISSVTFYFNTNSAFNNTRTTTENRGFGWLTAGGEWVYTAFYLPPMAGTCLYYLAEMMQLGWSYFTRTKNYEYCNPPQCPDFLAGLSQSNCISFFPNINFYYEHANLIKNFDPPLDSGEMIVIDAVFDFNDELCIFMEFESATATPLTNGSQLELVIDMTIDMSIRLCLDSLCPLNSSYTLKPTTVAQQTIKIYKTPTLIIFKMFGQILQFPCLNTSLINRLMLGRGLQTTRIKFPPQGIVASLHHAV
ncbi:uncharacterized protein LOC133357786 [Lethenteron reissneri]|uniref:uncharacterized protein LOC133357786 n=1 Tax=Lethenteron reissneri TaxID=7753 RepID=UPI002AB754E7|nr:uncharacterized protein LOC133357786 [Lethenteron reissneri]